MPKLAQQILEAVQRRPGITDRWLAEALFGPGTPQQRVNPECRRMAALGLLDRIRRPDDGLIGNYGTEKEPRVLQTPPSVPVVKDSVFSEDQLKTVLKVWLEAQGWEAEIAWGKSHGVDIHARRKEERWIIEAKGSGSLDPMRVNYFLNALGETLQRMNDSEAVYSIAFPDLKQFRNLWTRLPLLAKQRTKITAIFVCSDGQVEKVDN